MDISCFCDRGKSSRPFELEDEDEDEEEEDEVEEEVIAPIGGLFRSAVLETGVTVPLFVARRVAAEIVAIFACCSFQRAASSALFSWKVSGV